MGCSNIRERLSVYIEGDITSEEASRIDEHLRSCQECTESLSDLKKTVKHVRDLEDVEPPAWLTQKVMTKVREEAKPGKGIFQKLFYPLHIKLPIEAAATILIAVTAIYIFKNIQPEINLETYRPAKSPSTKAEPQVPAQTKGRPQMETKGKENIIPLILPLEKKGVGEIEIEAKRKESVIARDEVPEQSREIGVNSSIKKKEEIALKQLGESYGKREFPFEKEKAPVIAESKPAPAKPMEQEVFSGEPGRVGKFAGMPKAPAATEKRDIATKSAAVEEDKSKTRSLSDARERGKGIGKETKSITLRWTVTYIENAEKIADENIRLLGGRVSRVETYDDRRILVTGLSHKKLGELIEKLRLIGEIRESERTLEGLEGEMTVRIEIVGE